MKGYNKVKELSLIAVVLIIFSWMGCVKTTRQVRMDTSTKENKPDKKKMKDPKTADLSDYIRKVMKLSEESRAQKPSPPTGTLLESTIPQISEYKLMAAANPTNASVRFQLAAMYHKHGIYDLALSEYNAALKLDPQRAEIYEGLGRLWRDWGAPAAGLEDLKRAIALKPDFIEAHNSLGVTYDLVGDYQTAEKSYKAALKINPNVDYIHNNLCYNYLLQGKLDKAMDQCQIALKLNPNSDVAHNNLGLILGKMGDFEGSWQAFAAASGEAGAHNNLGLIYLEKKMYDQALDAFKRAAELRPAYKKASENYELAARLKFEESIAGAKPDVKKPESYVVAVLDAQRKAVEKPKAGEAEKTSAAQLMVFETAARRLDSAFHASLVPNVPAPPALHQPEMRAIHKKELSPSSYVTTGSEKLVPMATEKSLSSMPWARVERGIQPAQALPALPVTALPSFQRVFFNPSAPLNPRGELLNPIDQDTFLSRISSTLSGLKLGPIQNAIGALAWARLNLDRRPSARADADLQTLPLRTSLEKALEARIEADQQNNTLGERPLIDTKAPSNVLPTAKLPNVTAAAGVKPLTEARSLMNIEPVLKTLPAAGRAVDETAVVRKQMDEAKIKIDGVAESVSQAMPGMSASSKVYMSSKGDMKRKKSGMKSEARVHSESVEARAAAAVEAPTPTVHTTRRPVEIAALAFVTGLAFLAALALLASMGFVLWSKKSR